jgi:transposase
VEETEVDHGRQQSGHRRALWLAGSGRRKPWTSLAKKELSPGQRMRISAACADMWEPYRLSIHHWVPNCRIAYEKFHGMRNGNTTIDEVRRAEFIHKGGQM